jgi:hypothetical protein
LIERWINLIDQYKRISIVYTQLDQLPLDICSPFILDIEWDGVQFEFLIRIKKNAARALIFGSGAGGFQEQPIGPPIFHRHSWMDEFENTVIYYNDPTLYLGKLPLGWGQGTKERFYLKDIATILMKIVKKLQINHQNVLFYGSSGGGFMSLILAGFMKGSTAFVNNPQTDLLSWIPVPVNDVFRLAYPGLSREEVGERFSNRIKVLDFYSSIKYVPNIYFLQNAACEFDVQNHLLPFIAGLEKIGGNCEVNQFHIELYYDKKAGHAALGKKETIHYINKVSNREVREAKTLSVVIFCEKGNVELIRLLEKVRYLQPIEIIIVTPTKQEISDVIAKAAGYPLVVVEEKNQERIRVTGAKATKGDVVLFLQGDTVIYSVQLEQFLQPLVTNEADVVVTNVDNARKMEWPDVSVVYRQLVTDVVGHSDTKVGSLLCMPHAMTKKVLEHTGYESLTNPELTQLRLTEDGWCIHTSSAITTINSSNNYSSKNSYKNPLTKADIDTIKYDLQLLSACLKEKGPRGGFIDGGRKRDVIEQLKKEKRYPFIRKGFGMISALYHGQQLSVIIPAQNEETTIEQAILEARKIEPYEIIVVINGSTDKTEEIAKQLGATVIVYEEALGHDVGRAIGALEATGNILLFIDADFAIPAQDLHPLVEAVANGTDIALNDLNRNIKLPLYIVNVYKYMLNIACNRRDLGVGSLVAVPHAISRKCLEGIGWDTLYTSGLAQVKAILKGYKVECVNFVDVMKPNRIRPSQHFASVGYPPSVLRIIGDHVEGISYLLEQPEFQNLFLSKEGD